MGESASAPRGARYRGFVCVAASRWVAERRGMRGSDEVWRGSDGTTRDGAMGCQIVSDSARNGGCPLSSSLRTVLSDTGRTAVVSCPRAALSSLQILGTVGVSQKASRAFAHPSRWRRSSSPRRAASRASRPRSSLGALVAPRPSPRAASPRCPRTWYASPRPDIFRAPPITARPPIRSIALTPSPPPPPNDTHHPPPPAPRGAPHARALPHDDAREHRVVEDRGGREGERGRRARGRRDGQGDDGAPSPWRTGTSPRSSPRTARPTSRSAPSSASWSRTRRTSRRSRTTSPRGRPDATDGAPGGGPGAPAGSPPDLAAAAAPGGALAGGRMWPSVRRLLAESGLDPATIRATGPRARSSRAASWRPWACAIPGASRREIP